MRALVGYDCMCACTYTFQVEIIEYTCRKSDTIHAHVHIQLMWRLRVSVGTTMPRCDVAKMLVSEASTAGRRYQTQKGKED